jgi:hypothetical protein
MTAFYGISNVIIIFTRIFKILRVKYSHIKATLIKTFSFFMFSLLLSISFCVFLTFWPLFLVSLFFLPLLFSLDEIYVVIRIFTWRGTMSGRNFICLTFLP